MAIAAIVVGLMVVKIGWDLGWSALTELVDTALDEEEVVEGMAGSMALHVPMDRRMRVTMRAPPSIVHIESDFDLDFHDTYWQTETGSIALTPLPGVTATKPGSCQQPFFGIDAAVLYRRLYRCRGKLRTLLEQRGVLT